MSLKDSFGDAFITLPLLLIGFFFFIGTLTSNTGLLLLFFGHLVIVPALAFLGNVKGTLFNEASATGPIDFWHAMTNGLACFVFYLVHGGALSQASGDGAYGLLGLAAYPILMQFINVWWAFPERISHLDAFNPALFFFSSIKPSDSVNCSMLPTAPDATGKAYNHPSNWVNHLTFFFGFLISNAIAVYNEPTPTVTTASDPQQQDELQAKVDARVLNRKFITSCIGGISIVVFLVMLLFRYNKSGCEESIYLSAIPIVIAALTGASWFAVVTKCGVRPGDILGIVSGMIPSKMVDNPIVCVGS